LTTWVVGDIHGCADELAELVSRLQLGADDSLVSVGDLFHRGPDPAGVMDVLREARARFVLGNHEYRVLQRCGLAPTSTAPGDRPPRRDTFPPLEDDDLRGDGRRRCTVPRERRADVLCFLQEHSGFWLRGSDLGARPTPEGLDWYVVHAGVQPGVRPEDSPIESLVSARRLSGRGSPFWYERYEGPELVLFGHTPGKVPRPRRAGGKLVALGLDTACVYGGCLTAYSPELDELVAVRAARAYARA
jgi:serine/threonine protein phosphatase 1